MQTNLSDTPLQHSNLWILFYRIEQYMTLPSPSNQFTFGLDFTSARLLGVNDTERDELNFPKSWCTFIAMSSIAFLWETKIEQIIWEYIIWVVCAAGIRIWKHIQGQHTSWTWQKLQATIIYLPSSLLYFNTARTDSPPDAAASFPDDETPPFPDDCPALGTCTWRGISRSLGTWRRVLKVSICIEKVCRSARQGRGTTSYWVKANFQLAR